jgi:tetratricopeptide (TPR) repeat protein
MKKNKLKLINILLLSFFVQSCVSKGTVVVESNPQAANVFWIDRNTGTTSLLGQTPLTFSKNLAKDKNADIFELKFEKEGYESKLTSVASLGQETTFLNVQLSSTLSANSELRKSFELNRQLLAEATRLATNKRFSEALVRVEKILETDPKNDEALAAKGSLHYLMKDYENAELAWKKSLDLNPSNESVRSSIVDLKISIDSAQRLPAGSQPENK